MCVVPGGALREEALPPSRRPLQPGAAAFAALAPHPRLCGLDVQVRRSCVSEPRMAVRMVSPGERRRLPVAVSGRALQLRSVAAAQRRTALAMTEKENAETVEKSAEEIMALNLKLGDAAEAGDAELIRQLVEDGADVEYAPFVPDEEDDDEDDQDGDYSTNATEGSVEGTASVENPAPDVTVAGDGQSVDTCGVPGSRNLRCELIPVLSLLPSPAPPALSPILCVCVCVCLCVCV